MTGCFEQKKKQSSTTKHFRHSSQVNDGPQWSGRAVACTGTHWLPAQSSVGCERIVPQIVRNASIEPTVCGRLETDAK